MRLSFKEPILIFFVISLVFIFGLGFFLAEKPVWGQESSKTAELTKPPKTTKKVEKFIIKGREYCYECINNSECLDCHGNKINERKFAQSVHGALSCNGCHWDISDVKAHLRAKGSKIQTEPITCHRCHKREGAEHYASAHFINDVQ